MKRCWRCAEDIQDAAIVCRYCQAKQVVPPQPQKYLSNKQVLIIMGAIAALMVVAGISAKLKQPNIAEAPAISATTEAVSMADPYGNCLLRGMDNQSLNFAGLVKQRLRNPQSFEHVKTEPGPVKNGRFAVVMTYRATNGFGGIDTGTALGEIRVSDCAARVISAE